MRKLIKLLLSDKTEAFIWYFILVLFLCGLLFVIYDVAGINGLLFVGCVVGFSFLVQAINEVIKNAKELKRIKNQ